MQLHTDPVHIQSKDMHDIKFNCDLIASIANWRYEYRNKKIISNKSSGVCLLSVLLWKDIRTWGEDDDKTEWGWLRLTDD